MSYSIDPLTQNCYEGTTCLINKLNIRDAEKLAQVEAGITFAKAVSLEKNPIKGNFDLEHYCAIHRYLFEDIYEWAGKLREVEMSKKGTSFAKAETLPSMCTACFNRLHRLSYFRNLKFSEFAENIADLYSSLNLLHPFREGNGRTLRIFIAQLIRFGGYDIDFSLMDTDELMIATIHAAHGVNDYLIDLFSAHIKQN